MADLVTQLTDTADNYVNDPGFEFAWACKAAERAGVHMNLILAVDTKKLQLTKDQPEVYEKFRERFPDMNVESVSGFDI